MSMPWPGEDDPVVKVEYELVVGIDDKGEPIYKSGVDDDPERMRMIGKTLGELEPLPASITSVTMGSIHLFLRSGTTLTFRPVFHMTSGSYKDLLKVDTYDLPIPDSLVAVVNGWREDLSKH